MFLKLHKLQNALVEQLTDHAIRLINTA